MAVPTDTFERSIREQILLNQARMPTERMEALCDLLDTVRAMTPRGPEAEERRRRALAARERNREQLRAHLRQLCATRDSSLCGRSSSGMARLEQSDGSG